LVRLVFPEAVKSTTNPKTVLQVHWPVSLAALFVLVAYITLAEIPTTINWTTFAMMFWTGLTLRAIFAAAILYVIQYPAVAKRCWSRYREQPGRFVVIGGIFIWLTAWQGIGGGILNTVSAVAVAEFFDVRKFEFDRVSESIREIVAPSIYFFLGLMLVFTYNDVIITISARFFDNALLKIDSYFLAGYSVSAIARVASSILPDITYRLFDKVYFGMAMVLGSALLLLALLRGRKEACRYVGTLLLGYYGALVLFYLWPTRSPFYTCLGHFEHLATSDTKVLQGYLAARFEYTRNSFALNVDPDYFIAFPCMHIALPFIAWWFCRQWKRIGRAIFVYNMVLIPTILLLEFHYLADILGGLIVAALAVFISETGIALHHSRVAKSEFAAAPKV
jgi:PAP2 superfamily protein